MFLLVQSMNLSLVVAFHSVSVFFLPSIMSDLRRKFYLSVMNPNVLITNTPCTFSKQSDGSAGNFTAPCHQRVELPQYISACDSGYSLNYQNEYECDFVTVNLYKFASKDLPDTAPRVNSFVKAMSFSSDDTVRSQHKWRGHKEDEARKLLMYSLSLLCAPSMLSV